MHSIVTPGFVVKPHRSDCTAGQMDRIADWRTISGKMGLSPLTRVIGVGGQQQEIGVIDNVEGARVLYQPISVSIVIKKCI